MSVKVELADVPTAIAKQAPLGYLLTVSDDGRAHAVGVVAEVGGDTLRLLAGDRSRANAEARPAVTLLWPPAQPGDFTLLVDGAATVDGEYVVVRPTTAVLHQVRTMASGSNALQVESGGGASSGSATSSTVGPT